MCHTGRAHPAPRRADFATRGGAPLGRARGVLRCHRAPHGTCRPSTERPNSTDGRHHASPRQHSRSRPGCAGKVLTAQAPRRRQDRALGWPGVTSSWRCAVDRDEQAADLGRVGSGGHGLTSTACLIAEPVGALAAGRSAVEATAPGGRSAELRAADDAARSASPQERPTSDELCVDLCTSHADLN